MNAFQLSGEIIVVPIKSLKGDRKTLRCLHEFVDRVGMKVSTLGINMRHKKNKNKINTISVNLGRSLSVEIKPNTVFLSDINSLKCKLKEQT